MAAVNAVCHRRSPHDTAVPLPPRMQYATGRNHGTSPAQAIGAEPASPHATSRHPGGIADEDGEEEVSRNEATIRAGSARARTGGRGGQPGLGRPVLHG